MAQIFQPGDTVGTQHTVERFLGEGAFAQVYRVKHHVLGRQAMKVFKQPLQAGANVADLLSEAILLTRIGHPNIVRVFNADTLQRESESFGYFTMEYAGGGTLHDLWRSQGAYFLDVQTTIELLKQTARGLSEAHRADPPIIHRDIKPSNILVAITPGGYQAKVSDFGLAKQVNPLTLMATAAGTLPFKAPEVFATSKSDSLAADVWSLGVTLYMLLTDEMPFRVPEDEAPVRRHFDVPPSPPSRVNPDSDKNLDSIVMRALSVDPAERYPTAMALLEALESWKPMPPGSAPRNMPRSSSTQSLKTILPPVESAEHKLAEQLMKSAYDHARNGHLPAAADALEEALKSDPSLRAAHESRIRLWRMGVAM